MSRKSFPRFELGKNRGVSDETIEGARCFNEFLDLLEDIDSDTFSRQEFKSYIEQFGHGITGERPYLFGEDKSREIDNVMGTILASAVRQKVIDRVFEGMYKVNWEYV